MHSPAWQICHGDTQGVEVRYRGQRSLFQEYEGKGPGKEAEVAPCSVLHLVEDVFRWKRIKAYKQARFDLLRKVQETEECNSGGYGGNGGYGPSKR